MSQNTFRPSGQSAWAAGHSNRCRRVRATQKPLILAVETSGRLGSVAIALGEQMLGESAFSGPMRHSAEIFPAVCGLLERFGYKPEQIEQIHISVGPGSFTGLRIAVTLAKMMNLASDTKIVAVDTLDVIAANAAECIERQLRAKGPAENVAAVLDAKRRQFFVAVYRCCLQRSAAAEFKVRDVSYEKTLQSCLMTAEEFVERYGNRRESVRLTGEGLVYYKERFRAKGIGFFDERCWCPTAENVHLLGRQKALRGEFADGLTLQPRYLRRVDVKIKERK